ncbi:hypothetical protein ULMA_03620 [Patiriisocius marinus]|uniref:BLUF domain-containing protein n=1 Tax=Patiriisocius marinus TaxID=1397112 RepID=A0A5J4IU88_9FLAO|nr:BLUF domain-containing protein [Patiriisocius marinus]GER58254.1 hypothetical protein ULMA_03620 [Patiriisocius marinus]
MSLRRIIYTSHATNEYNKRDLLDLLHESRGYNSIDNISGVLMYRDGYFLQIIEGEDSLVDDLVKRIANDTRHDDIKIINDALVEQRLFPGWSMGCADFEDPTLSLIPGISNEFTNPQFIDDLLDRLPEVASYIHKNLTKEQIYGAEAS